MQTKEAPEGVSIFEKPKAIKTEDRDSEKFRFNTGGIPLIIWSFVRRILTLGSAALLHRDTRSIHAAASDVAAVATTEIVFRTFLNDDRSTVKGSSL